jgi:hypothetical protein
MRLTAVFLVVFSGLSGAFPAAAGYANLPLSFEKNAAQAENRVLFLARSNAGVVGLTADGMVFMSRNATVGMALKGIRATKASPSAEKELPGRVNYLIGANPAQWRTGLPTFARVRYHDVYRGIDLIYYAVTRISSNTTLW